MTNGGIHFLKKWWLSLKQSIKNHQNFH